MAAVSAVAQFVVVMMVLAIIKVPIAFSILLSTLTLIISRGLPIDMVAPVLFTSLDSITLVALAYFMFAGDMMGYARITDALLNVVRRAVGHMKGSLGAVQILGSALFGAVCGSSLATVSAVGSIMRDGMLKAGYRREYFAAITAATGFLGTLIPPSIPGITYALAAGLPVFSVWIAAITPAVLVIIGYLIINYLQSKETSIETGALKFSTYAIDLGKEVWHGSYALVLPLIILGGVYTGIFTATEAGAVASIYAVFWAFVYTFRKRLTGRDGFFVAVVNSAINVGGICILISTAMVAARVFTLLQVPLIAAQFMQSISTSWVFFILCTNVLLLILGMLLETNTSILITVPILAPIAATYGIDPLHFATIVLLNLEIGLITPPFAANIFVATTVAGVSMERMLKDLMPFFLWDLVVLAIISYVPAVSHWLPSVLGY